MPVIPINDEEDDDWAFDDEDDVELLQILQATSTKSKQQTTLDGNIIPTPQYEEIPRSIPVNIPSHHPMDFENLKTYIYPTNFEIRDYQYNIVNRAFYDNLLVALPTGLGKTFIASTVMLNFLRWFPQSKLIFMAPTRPLVAQQIKACCSITGIPTSKVAILLDKIRKNREEIWDSRQVFFTTPQVVENDLARGILNPKSIVLLVIDEAHRARGNYSYNNVVKFLTRFNNSFRILALTATPAGDVEGVQDIIDNLKISKVEVRTEQAIDIIKYMKHKQIVKRTIGSSNEIQELIGLLATAISPVLTTANERGIFDITDPTRINHFQCMEASRKVTMNKTIPQGLKWSNYFILQLLGMVGQCYKRLNIYGIKSFASYFQEKYQEFKVKWVKKKSKNQLNADFYFNDSIKQLLRRLDELQGKGYSHPKIEALVDELTDFFPDTVPSDSRVIIFTEYRESALEIVQCIERTNSNLKPHIFIGQAKEKERFDETKSKSKSKKRKQDDEDDLRSSTRTSSEDAQIKGMNQKLQKEIIKKFKAGTYNILVATSIGEEGLDIGEVDLIICYDSTSSPIKNIQRMGRTGRKRDGKVVLLFSSNEESKFEKAMASYEYIQQHIQKGDLITLCPRNRIIPDIYTPKVVEKFIEIPEENIELKSEDDEDEIIRIATQYMLGNSQKNKKKKKQANTSSKTSSKTTSKKFFMPDNVVTGFQSVTSMIREVGDDKSVEERKRERDILDSFLVSSDDDELEVANLKKRKVQISKNSDDGLLLAYSRPVDNQETTKCSDSDDDLPIASSRPITNQETSDEEIAKGQNTPASSLPSEPPTTSKPEVAYQLPIDSDDDFSFGSSDEEIPESTREPTPLPLLSSPKQVKPKSLGVKRAVIVPKTNESIGTVKPIPQAKPTIIPNYDNIPSSFNPHAEIGKPKKTLGLKRTRVNILDQLKKQQSRQENRNNNGTQLTPIVLDDIELPSYTPESHNYTDVKVEPQQASSCENDDHGDISINLKQEQQKTDNTRSENVEQIKDSIYDFGSENEGLLTSEEKIQLYTNYYVANDPNNITQFYDPSEGLTQNKKCGVIPHSLKTENLINCLHSKVLQKLETTADKDSNFDFSFIVND